MPVAEPYNDFWAAVQSYDVEWPATDEDATRTVAEAWTAAGADFTVAGNGENDMLKDGWTDPVGQNYKQTVDRLRADSKTAGEGMTWMGDITEAYADDVGWAKENIAQHIGDYAPIYDRLAMNGAAAQEQYAANEAAIINTFLNEIASGIAARNAGGPMQPREFSILTTDDDPGTYVPPPLIESAAKGAAREQTVAELTGGTVIGSPGGEGLIVTDKFGKSTDVDVIGPEGEFIAVGGPAKENENNRDGRVIEKLAILQDAAVRQGTHAEAWFTSDTPPNVIAQAQKLVGVDNVHVFDG